MEVKKITEGMTAPQVAKVIDDNFVGLNNEKANKEETDAKLSELASELREEIKPGVYDGGRADTKYGSAIVVDCGKA